MNKGTENWVITFQFHSAPYKLNQNFPSKKWWYHQLQHLWKRKNPFIILRKPYKNNEKVNRKAPASPPKQFSWLNMESNSVGKCHNSLKCYLKKILSKGKLTWQSQTPCTISINEGKTPNNQKCNFRMLSNRNLLEKIKREKEKHFERPRKASENQGCREVAAERKGEELYGQGEKETKVLQTF